MPNLNEYEPNSLTDMRPVGRKQTVDAQVAVGVEHHLVEVPRAAGVGARPGALAEGFLSADAHTPRSRDLVRIHEARVVAVEAAEDVAAAEEPVIAEAAIRDELERRVVPLGLRAARTLAVRPVVMAVSASPSPGLP